MKRPWRWAGVAVLLVVCGAGTLAWRAQPASAPPTRAAAPGPASLALPVQASTAASSASMASASAVVAVAAAPLRAASQADKAFIDLCGVGKVRRTELELREGAPGPLWQTLNQMSERALPELLRRLDAGTLSQRTAAAVVRNDIDQAALLASAGNDIASYRIALRACRHHGASRKHAAYLKTLRASPAASGMSVPDLPDLGPEPTACASLNVERLEALDTTDAWPWLLRLGDSLQSRDAAGVTQALYQLGQRDWPQVRTRTLGEAVAQVVGDEPTSDDALAMLMFTGVDASRMLDGSPATIPQACRPDALADANRRQLCEQVARRMPRMVSELLDARTLYALEERLGLAHSTQAMSADAMNRASRAISDVGTRAFAEPTCANFRHMAKQFTTLFRGGELAYLQARMKSGAASAAQ